VIWYFLAFDIVMTVAFGALAVVSGNGFATVFCAVLAIGFGVLGLRTSARLLRRT
jgi:hypothetical protein